MGKSVPRMCMIEISGLHHLRISVTNLVRSKEFYSEVIGFEVAAESPGSPEEPAVRTATRGRVPRQWHAVRAGQPQFGGGGDVGVADSGGLHPSNASGSRARVNRSGCHASPGRGITQRTSPLIKLG